MKLKIILPLVFLVGICTQSGTLLAAEPTDHGTLNTSRSTLSFDQIKKSAEGGDADAQYALGYMYYYGKSGATRDIIEAKKWIGKAADQKQPQAVRAFALLTKKQQGASEPAADSSTKQESVVQAESSPPEKTPKLAEKSGNLQKKAMTDKDEDNMTLVDMRKNHPIAEQDEASRTTGDANASSASGSYTLQLMGGYNKDQVIKTIQKHHLTKAEVYQTSHNNKDWYVLLYGRYQTRAEANEAAKDLEKQLSVKPWAKPYATVKTYKKVGVD